MKRTQAWFEGLEEPPTKRHQTEEASVITTRERRNVNDRKTVQRRPHRRRPTPKLPPPSRPHIDASKEANQESRLLSLPRELRDMIYDHAFHSTADLDSQSINKRNAGLLLTCKQICSEGLKPYYQHSIFTSKKRSNMLKWIGARSPRVRKWLRDVRWDVLDLSPRSFDHWLRISETWKTVLRYFGGEVGDGVIKAAFRAPKDAGVVWYSVGDVRDRGKFQELVARYEK